MFNGCADNVLIGNEKCNEKIIENNAVEEIDEENVIIVTEKINESFWITLKNNTSQEEMN